MRRYIRSNKQLLRFIRRKDLKINDIKSIKKGKGILKHIFISSYRVDYDIIDMKG